MNIPHTQLGYLASITGAHYLKHPPQLLVSLLKMTCGIKTPFFSIYSSFTKKMMENNQTLMERKVI